MRSLPRSRSAHITRRDGSTAAGRAARGREGESASAPGRYATASLLADDARRPAVEGDRLSLVWSREGTLRRAQRHELLPRYLREARRRHRAAEGGLGLHRERAKRAGRRSRVPHPDRALFRLLREDTRAPSPPGSPRGAHIDPARRRDDLARRDAFQHTRKATARRLCRRQSQGGATHPLRRARSLPRLLLETQHPRRHAGTPRLRGSSRAAPALSPRKAHRRCPPVDRV